MAVYPGGITNTRTFGVPMPAIVNEENCSGCASCVDACPTSAIAMVDSKAKVKVDDCTSCGACESACPTGAISVS